eukprot:575268-Rhodomonas_salina.2
MIPGVWGALAPQDTITVYDSWYAYKGGVAAANNPQATDATGDAYAGVSYAINARLWPYDTVKSKPTQVQALLEELALASKLGPVNYFLGGKIRSQSPLFSSHSLSSFPFPTLLNGRAAASPTDFVRSRQGGGGECNGDASCGAACAVDGDDHRRGECPAGPRLPSQRRHRRVLQPPQVDRADSKTRAAWDPCER